MRPKTNFHCNRCGKHKIESKYSIDENDRKFCDPCGLAIERERLLESDTYPLYGPRELSPGQWLINWAGGKLMRLTAIGNSPHNRSKGSTWGEKYYVNAIDVHGQEWSGWVGVGVISTMYRKR
jgi:hypothetical protein